MDTLRSSHVGTGMPRLRFRGTDSQGEKKKKEGAFGRNPKMNGSGSEAAQPRRRGLHGAARAQPTQPTRPAQPPGPGGVPPTMAVQAPSGGFPAAVRWRSETRGTHHRKAGGGDEEGASSPGAGKPGGRGSPEGGRLWPQASRLISLRRRWRPRHSCCPPAPPP